MASAFPPAARNFSDLPGASLADRPLTGAPVREAADRQADPAALFTDRDLSLLRFQQRVLEEARDPRHPLLDRVRFVAIVGTNLDDFIMVRGPRVRTDPARRLVVEAVVKRLFRDAHLAWRRDLLPALRAAGIHLLKYASLTPAQRDEVDRHFTQFVAPQLTAVAWEADRPCPAVPSLGLNVLVQVEDAGGREGAFVVHLPDTCPPMIGCRSDERLADAPVEPRGYVWLDQVVLANLSVLLPRRIVKGAYAFRVLREADPLADAELVEDPLERADRVVRCRDTNPVVMLAADRRIPPALLQRLSSALGVSAAAVHCVKHVPGLRRKWEVSRIGRDELHRPDIRPRVPARLHGRADVLGVIREGDLLLHHPFESFQPVVDLLRQAARDPDVFGIAITLYRTDRESPVAHALIEAARHGKHVRAVIELSARFDEARNAAWARRLSEAGVHVFFAPHGLKVHAKMSLVERHEGDGVRRYVHISSGNYNAFTATAYTDVALLTCRDEVGGDVARLFEALTGAGANANFAALVVAPLAMQSRLEALVEREIDWCRRGSAGYIVLKMNALSDRETIRLLYRASQAGVRIDLLVRGICCLRPGVPGLSDTIRVRSVVGRFLEHSRIWWFRNGGSEQAYIGSADMMPRNFNRRVEVMTPVLEPALIRRVRDEILGSYLADTAQARELCGDGAYVRVTPAGHTPRFDAQAALIDPRHPALPRP